MLIEFKFGNFRSFRDEAVLSMEAMGLGRLKNCLISYNSMKLIPSVAIYGKNGGGKSNVIRAFWLAVQFIKNAQRTQHENAKIPVKPFLLNDYSKDEPTFFEFTYVLDNVKYIYGFSATKEKIFSEYLYHSPKGQKATVFTRAEQKFTFTEEKAKRKLISEAVAPNQLFFSVACTMNDADCMRAMKWFREYVFFSRDYTDIPKQLLEYSNDKNMLAAISGYAKAADLGIEKMEFEFKDEEVKDFESEKNIPEEIRSALTAFMQNLKENSNISEIGLQKSEVRATSYHKGINKNGVRTSFTLDLSDESDGTRKLMSIAPAIESVLNNGGIVLVDELEKELHPMLVNYIVAKFQSKTSNPNGAQLIFTTHNTELLDMELMRKDQLYFADINRNDGASDLYNIGDFTTKTADNIRKGYLAGKYGATPDIEISEVD